MDTFVNDNVKVQSISVPDKVNPKLDSFLNQLAKAQKEGDSDSFARKKNVKLENGSILVIIESTSAELDKAVLALNNAGAGQIKAGVGNINNWIRAQVPVTSLDTLADEESIQFIRIPSSLMER